MTEWLQQVRQHFTSALRIFIRIKGTDRAGAFAYYGLFSLFPSLALIISVASFFVDRGPIFTTLSGIVENYLPINESLEKTIESSVESLIFNRDKMGIVSFFVLIWGTSKFINTLISSINLAWGIQETNWWLRSLKNLIAITFVNILFIVSLAIPAAVQAVRRITHIVYIPQLDYDQILSVAWDVIPFCMLFIGITVLYYMAPQHKCITIKDVWKQALVITILLKVIQDAFSYFVTNFSSINVFYGALGEIFALLLWIHITGVLIIFGACLSACSFYSTPTKNYLS